MNTSTKLTIVLLIIALGIGLSLNQEQSDVKPSWVHEVKWLDKPDNAAKIEELLWTEINPYRTEYDTVNISASKKNSGQQIKVVANIKDTNSLDIYDFLYDNNELVLTGYLLEAIPPMYRDEAIGIALGNQEVVPLAANAGIPTVKRILPRTSEKFYAPKILLSVTWKGISALIDPDERKVVKVWKEGSYVNGKYS